MFSLKTDVARPPPPPTSSVKQEVTIPPQGQGQGTSEEVAGKSAGVPDAPAATKGALSGYSFVKGKSIRYSPSSHPLPRVVQSLSSPPLSSSILSCLPSPPLPSWLLPVLSLFPHQLLGILPAGMLPKYFDSEWSVAQVHGLEGRSVCAFIADSPRLAVGLVGWVLRIPLPSSVMITLWIRLRNLLWSNIFDC